jgi:hypothetical protein
LRKSIALDATPNKLTTSILWKLTLILIPALVVALSAVVVERVIVSNSDGNSANQIREGEYYLYPLSVELEGKKPNGSPWDSLGNSAPDPFVTIEWKGEEVYKSSTKNDTLLANWSIAEFNLAKIAVAGGKTSVDDHIKAARISFSQGGSITVKIWDDDITMNDFIAEIQIPFTDLAIGENTFSPTLPGVTKITLRLVDIRTAPDLLQ